MKEKLYPLTLEELFALRVDELRQASRYSTARNYQSTCRCLHRYCGGQLPPASAIDATFLSGFEQWMLSQGLQWNTVSFYNRILRALLNEAARRGVAVADHPFARAFTAVDVTRHRSVSVEVLHRLQQLDLRGCPPLSLSRDLFLFGFASQGMPFVDIAFLRTDDVTEGYLTYHRHKTGQTIRMQVQPLQATLIQRHHVDGAFYLFPVLTSRDPRTAWQEYVSALTVYNRHLHTLSRRADIHPPLTSYVARHTWATAARDNQVPVSVIGAALGHTSERTTRIYLSSFSDAETDLANRKVIESLEKCKRVGE